jgi:SAM-dependent methyltransferase
LPRDVAAENPFLADAAARYHRGRPYHHERTLGRAFELRAVPRGRAVDVACGTGLSTRALRSLGFTAVGADVSAPMLAVARHVEGIPSVRAEAERLPVATGSCALVTVSSAVHWFAQDRFYGECRRVLSPEGTLVVYDHMFLGQASAPEVGEWFLGDFLARYPVPPRNAMVAQEHEHPGFRLVAEDTFEDLRPMTCEEFTGYLLTISNVVVTVDRGDETVDDVEARITAACAPHFAGGTLDVSFLTRVECLARV